MPQPSALGRPLPADDDRQPLNEGDRQQYFRRAARTGRLAMRVCEEALRAPSRLESRRAMQQKYGNYRRIMRRTEVPLRTTASRYQNIP
jgi:hypothetical protein